MQIFWVMTQGSIGIDLLLCYFFVFQDKRYKMNNEIEFGYGIGAGYEL